MRVERGRERFHVPEHFTTIEKSLHHKKNPPLEKKETLVHMHITHSLLAASVVLSPGFHTGFSIWGGRCVWVNWDGRVLFPGHAQKWC